MNNEQHDSAGQGTGNRWGLKAEGLIMGQGSRNEVHEFTGMWPLEPDFDLEQMTTTLAPGGLLVPPGGSFAPMTTKLGLIRAARWFVATSTEFGGPTLYFVSQFDGSLEKYFDDFVLNGAENLGKIWGQCVGCPKGADATAHDIVAYIARGQIKTLACYDGYPGLSHGQIHKAADWYEKTLRFQRAVSSVDGNLEDTVNAFLTELAEPYKTVPSEAVIDVDAGREWQYQDVTERVLGTKLPKAA